MLTSFTPSALALSHTDVLLWFVDWLPDVKHCCPEETSSIHSLAPGQQEEGAGAGEILSGGGHSLPLALYPSKNHLQVLGATPSTVSWLGKVESGKWGCCGTGQGYGRPGPGRCQVFQLSSHQPDGRTPRTQLLLRFLPQANLTPHFASQA